MSDKLKVGDVLYTVNRWYGLQRHVIERVTPKQAVSGNTKFRIDILTFERSYGEQKEAAIIGEYGNAKLETPVLKAEYQLKLKRLKVYQLLKTLNPDKMGDALCDKFIELITSIS